MKVLLLLALIFLSSSLRTKEEPAVLATKSVSLQNLLDQVKEISNQLSEESLLEVPPSSTKPSNSDSSNSFDQDT